MTTPIRSAAVEFRGVTKRFGETVAVDALSFRIEPGEFFPLLGPSGCGKTTTLRLLAGFEIADVGTILINGDEANHQRPYERPLAMVFQNYALFPHLSVARNVAFGLEQRKRPAAEIERRVRDALALVQLDPATYARRMPAELSGGQRQRVALARALVLEPAILLLDEPLGALDLKLRKEMQLELKRLNHETGTTFVYVTHDQEEALAMSDRIAVMNHARIAQIGTPPAVYEDPRTRFVADFIGEANFLGGKAERRQGDRNDGGQAAGRPGGQHDSHVAAGLSPAVFWEVVHSTGARFVVADHPTIREGSHVEIAIRPEWHDLWRDGEAPPGENTLSATVSDIVYLGETIHVERGFTLGHYARFLDPLYLSVLGRTVWLSLLATAGCFLLGLPTAWVISRSAPQWRNLLLFLVVLPFWTSSLVRTYAMMFMLRDTGLVNSLLLHAGLIQTPLHLLYTEGAVLAGLVYAALPFMVLPLYASVEKLDPALLEAAEILGAGPWARFRHVIFPLILPGMVTGSLLVFIPSLGSFVVPDLLGGAKQMLIGNLVQNQFGPARNWPFGSAVSFGVMGVVLVVILVFVRRGERGERGEGEEIAHRSPLFRASPPSR